jgi:hypothetical protein
MDAEVKEKKAKEQKPIDVLRQRHGGMTDELKKYFGEQVKLRKALSEVLKKGPRTAPELAAELKLDSALIFWHLMAMKKYGAVVEGAQRGDYFEYLLKEAE